MSKKRGILISLVGGALALGLLPATAQAEPSCPPGATLSPWAVGVRPDRNMNGLVCIRFIPGGHGPVFIPTDDQDR